MLSGRGHCDELITRTEESYCCLTLVKEYKATNKGYSSVNAGQSEILIYFHKHESRTFEQYFELVNTGLFISPSGISELDCATTKTDTAERSISIGIESFQDFFCTRGLGILPGSTARE